MIDAIGAGNERLRAEVEASRKRLAELERQIEEILRLLRKLLDLQGPQCGKKYTPKKPLIYSTLEKVPISGRFIVSWAQEGNWDPNTDRWELLEYSHDNDSEWVIK